MGNNTNRGTCGGVRPLEAAVDKMPSEPSEEATFSFIRGDPPLVVESSPINIKPSQEALLEFWRIAQETGQPIKEAIGAEPAQPATRSAARRSRWLLDSGVLKGDCAILTSQKHQLRAQLAAAQEQVREKEAELKLFNEKKREAHERTLKILGIGPEQDVWKHLEKLARTQAALDEATGLLRYVAQSNEDWTMEQETDHHEICKRDAAAFLAAQGGKENP